MGEDFCLQAFNLSDRVYSHNLECDRVLVSVAKRKAARNQIDVKTSLRNSRLTEVSYINPRCLTANEEKTIIQNR